MRCAIPPISAEPQRKADGRGRRRLRTGERVWCVLAVIAGVGLLLTARWFFNYAWSNPVTAPFFSRPCLLKLETGVPCPFCGATRSTVAAARGQLVRSLKLSPLGIPMVAGAAAVIVWLGACAVVGRDFGLSAAARGLAKLPLGRITVGGVAALWFYKIIADCVLKWD